MNEEQTNDVVINDEGLSLKITSDRKLWRRLATEKQFVHVGELPYGMSKEQKIHFLVRLHEKAKEMMSERT